MTIPPDAQKRVWRLYNEGWTPLDFGVVHELLDPGIVWTAIESAPDAGTYLGYEGVQSYIQDWHDDFEFGGEEFRVYETIEIGDRLVCVQHAAATGKGSGLRTEIDYACVYRFGNDGRIVELNEYATREEAVDAASQS